ncbi:amidohydrolase family protein [Leptolyngbyaceae cyanobacterium UHCC 1019]
MATIFRNAHLLDPMQGIEGRGDVLVDNGKIVGVLQEDSAIGKIVPILVPQWDTQIIDLEGAFLSPGWMDIHTHVCNTLGDFCLSADDVGIRSGVTTIADAGTSSILTFDAFRQTAIATAKTRVFSFMNPSLLYIATSDLIAHQLDIVANPRNQNIDRAAAVVEAHRDVIVGFHVRPVRRTGEITSPLLETAKKLAELFSLPLLVHLGHFSQDEVVPATELLPQLKAGDIVTHCFQPNHALFDQNQNLLPAAKDAIDRGVLLDVGYSNADCSSELAKAAIAQGILPNILSTNLNRSTVATADSLAAVMTRFVNLGLSLSEVVERVTHQPAAAIGQSSQLGGFKPGQLADFTIFEWNDEPAPLKDGSDKTKTMPQRLKVKGVCRSGDYFHIERSPFETQLQPVT